ncbi:zinc finger protein 85-like isoform X3 [Zootermopsis nevadensis]|uniref:zinc finger protein 85-like isoform X3 n=1 Tax=Zootermopsis nevadensis TaxID=136037 RepID=UPI000B8E432A|nr:zinc finger protein 85-like isoform X3 [Zootermopsis nevadensis]
MKRVRYCQTCGKSVEHYQIMALNLREICRLCLEEIKKPSTTLKEESSLLTRIRTFLPVLKIQPGDGLPAFVCEECENLVNICYNFKLQVEKSNLTLKKYYANQEEYLPLTKKDDATADTTAMNIAASSYHDGIECAVGVHLLAPLGVNNSSSDVKNTETHGVLVPKTKLEHSSDCETEYEETGNTSLSLDNQCHTPQYMKDYKSHINRSETHMKEKPYMCAYCGHSFRYMSSLTRHLLIHSGEKRYACDICNKAFTQEAHLKTHSILHTGEKPFHCNICLMEFSRKGNLKRHLQVHKGNKASVCYMKTHVADTILHCTRKNQNLLIDYNEDS